MQCWVNNVHVYVFAFILIIGFIELLTYYDIVRLYPSVAVCCGIITRQWLVSLVGCTFDDAKLYAENRTNYSRWYQIACKILTKYYINLYTTVKYKLRM